MLDTLVSGKGDGEHLHTLHAVFKKLIEFGLGLSKCKFLGLWVEYVGNLVNVQGLHATQSKLKAINEAPTP